MKLFILLCLMLSSCIIKPNNHYSFKSQGVSLDNIIIINSYDESVNTDFLKETALNAYNHFITIIGQPKKQIVIKIGGENCLRVGYSFEGEKTVNFCSVKDIIEMGTTSKDVITHELFHSMLCSIREDVCQKEIIKEGNVEAIHEGLADYFTYLLYPDSNFGEMFYKNKDFIRQYLTDYCYSMVNGSHYKGNAITSNLIRRNFSSTQLKNFVTQSNFSLDELFKNEVCFMNQNYPELKETAENYPASYLRRFRINKEKPLILNFEENEVLKKSYSNISFEWSNESNVTFFNIKQLTETKFSVTGLVNKGFSKYVLLIKSNNKTIGGKEFYFSNSNN